MESVTSAVTGRFAITPSFAEMSWHRTLCGVVGLMARSPIHRVYSVADIERLIVPPLRARQAIVVEERGHIVGFGSVALLTEEAQQGYRDGKRRIKAEDWSAGQNIWLIDVVAPYGHAAHVTKALRHELRDRGFAGEYVNFRRNKGTGERRYARVMI